MGIPVVRVTDKTSHGGMVSSGAATVFAGGLPVARLTDAHVCPWHGGGPIVKTSTMTVIVEGRPVAVIGDQAICGGPDILVQGCPTVVVTGSAQAGTLRAAAENGTPFCEQCDQ